MPRKITFARAFLFFFPPVFILLTIAGVSPAKLVFNSLLISLMLAWVARVLSRSPRRCPDSELFNLEQRRRAERRRFSAELKKAERLAEAGDIQEAAGIVDKVLAESPYFPEALYVRAVIHAERGEDEEALARLRLAMQNAPVEDRCFRRASALHSEIIMRKQTDAHP